VEQWKGIFEKVKSDMMDKNNPNRIKKSSKSKGVK